MLGKLRKTFMLWEIEYSYNIQRRYPFKYFTRTVTTILILLFGFFCVYNIAANGFDLQIVYTTDPNTTQTQTHWYMSLIFTFGDDKLSPKCQSRDLSVAEHFTTTNQGALYTLNSITTLSGHDAGSNVNLITFLNNTLDDCKGNTLEIEMDQRTNARISNTWDWKGTLTASASCIIVNDEGRFRVQFTASDDTPFAVNANYTTHASVWWGRKLLGLYRKGLKIVLGRDPRLHSNSSTSSTSGVVKHCGITFDVNETMVDDVESMDLFHLRYATVFGNDSILHQNIDSLTGPERYNNDTFKMSRALTEALSIARVYYSLIQLDLNQVQRPNLFLSEDILRGFLNSSTNFNHRPGGFLASYSQNDWVYDNNISFSGATGVSQSVPLDDSYAKLRPQTGPLGSRSAFVSLQYVCSVPSRRSIGTIVWTRLIANFVLLAAAHAIITFFAQQAVAKRDPTAMYCDGCAAQIQSLNVLTPPLRGMNPSDKAIRSRHGSIHTSDSTHTLTPLRLRFDEDGNVRQRLTPVDTSDDRA